MWNSDRLYHRDVDEGALLKFKGCGVQCHFQQYFSYIVAASFIGRGNRSTRRKPWICSKSLNKLYHIMLHRVHPAWAGFELTTLVVIGTDCIGSCKSNYHTIKITTTTTVPVTTMQGSTLTVVRLPGASEMRLRASENDTQLVRSGKWKWFCDMFNSWRAKWLILNYSVLEVAANFT